MADDNTYTKSNPAGHKKIFEVVKASRKNFSAITGQGKERRFGKNGVFTTRDPKLAKEINQKYGYDGGTRDVVVVEREEHTRGPNPRLFLNPGMPWHEEEE